jgi:transcriptional antiterminator NusG
MTEEQELVQEKIQIASEVEEETPEVEEEAVAEVKEQAALEVEEKVISEVEEEVSAEVEEEAVAEVKEQAALEVEEKVISEVEDEVAAGVEEQALAEVEEEPTGQEGRFWYVIHSYSGYENKVKRNLESRIESMGMQDYIFGVVVPTEDVVELRDGHRRTVERRIFPGYILVDMIMMDESWFVVRNTPGVTGFVGSGSQPTPLRTEEADAILKRMEEEAPKVKVSFGVGETVRIVDGPFTDFLGTVDHLNLDKGKVRLLVSFFGRETPVELDFLQVEKE